VCSKKLTLHIELLNDNDWKTLTICHPYIRYGPCNIFTVLFLLMVDATEAILSIDNREKMEILDGCGVFVYIHISTSGSNWLLCCLFPSEKGKRTR
jgi:hypothetical protein